MSLKKQTTCLETSKTKHSVNKREVWHEQLPYLRSGNVTGRPMLGSVSWNTYYGRTVSVPFL